MPKPKNSQFIVTRSGNCSQKRDLFVCRMKTANLVKADPNGGSHKKKAAQTGQDQIRPTHKVETERNNQPQDNEQSGITDTNSSIGFQVRPTGGEPLPDIFSTDLSYQSHLLNQKIDILWSVMRLRVLCFDWLWPACWCFFCGCGFPVVRHASPRKYSYVSEKPKSIL